MTRSDSVFLPQSEFDDFLFATLSEDASVFPLSVLSALARLDLDPWQEAAELARLPKGQATQKLAALIAGIPQGPSVPLEPKTTAVRLIALLPHRTVLPVAASRKTLLAAGNVANSRAIAISGFVMGCLLIAGWILATSQPLMQSEAVRAPTPSAASHELPTGAGADTTRAGKPQ